MIAIVDYGARNLYSLKCSIEFIGAECEVTADARRISGADGIILPGVGAFADAAEKLRESSLDQAVITQARQGKPLLGICLGMQLLYDESCEYGVHKGLGLVPGRVESLAEAIDGNPLKVPHMGWNSLLIFGDCPLLKYTSPGDYVYYVHSYYTCVSEHTAASSRYGTVDVTGVTWRENVFGTQFHPEKSGSCGLDMLRAFAHIAAGKL